MRRDMAHPWEQDLRYTRRELAKIVVGSAVVGFAMWAVMALIALVPTA